MLSLWQRKWKHKSLPRLQKRALELLVSKIELNWFFFSQPRVEDSANFSCEDSNISNKWISIHLWFHVILSRQRIIRIQRTNSRLLMISHAAIRNSKAACDFKTACILNSSMRYKSLCNARSSIHIIQELQSVLGKPCGLVQCKNDLA